MRKYTGIMLAMALVFCFSTTMAFAEPTVSIKPSYAQRILRNGDFSKVRMHIVLSGAENLLSFGVKLTYDKYELTIVEHHKNDTVWNVGMGSYKEGNELFFFGASTEPVSGDDILLGWVVFQAHGCPLNMPVNVPVTVDWAKDPPYDNFVNASGDVKDDYVTFEGANICLIHPDVYACEGDFNGDGQVFFDDCGTFRASFLKAFGDPDYNPGADFNADGQVFFDDASVFREDFPRTDCPSCP